jgi:hypothetical protein
MATKFVTNLDLVQNQILNGRFEVLASDPSSGNFDGRLIFNSTEGVIKVYDDTSSTWRKALYQITSGTTALTASESNGSVALSIADAVNNGASGLLSGTDKKKLDDAATVATPSTLVLRDAAGRFQAVAPSADADVATKSYVDATKAGLDVKDSVRAATTDPGTLATDFEDGDTIDGVTLATGDRILIKNQADGAENGIYVVAASGAPTRATDADSSVEVTGGMFTFVEEGTTNADSGWVLTNNGSITVGTTALTFVQFSGAGQITAGAGLTKTGNTLDVGGTADRITVNADTVDIASTYVGQSSITTLGTIGTGTWEATDVAVLHGGTGSSTASGARTNLAATSAGGSTTTPVLARSAAQDCAVSVGDTSVTTVTHNYGTKDVLVQVFEVSSGATVIADTVRTSNDVVTVTINGSGITLGQYRIVVTG